MYKVLVLDQYTKDILAPLLRVNDLRKHGITLHLVHTPLPPSFIAIFAQSPVEPTP